MFAGDADTFCVVDFCCGSGSATLAAVTLGYNVVALDNDASQQAGFQARVRKFMAEHQRIQNKAAKGKREPGGPKGAVEVNTIPWQYGSSDSTAETISPFSRQDEDEKAPKVDEDESV